MTNLGRVRLQIEITLECGHTFTHAHESAQTLTNAEVVNDVKMATELATRLAMTIPHTCSKKNKALEKNPIESDCDDCGLK